MREADEDDQEAAVAFTGSFRLILVSFVGCPGLACGEQ